MPSQVDAAIRSGVSREADPVRAVAELHCAIGDAPASLVAFFASPRPDLDQLGEAMQRVFGGVPLLGCTTAGEITPDGYIEGSVTAFALPADGFTVVSARIDDLDGFELGRGHSAARTLLERLRLRGKVPTPTNTFAFLLVDGLSIREEAVTSAAYAGLQGIPLFGGSAADRFDFRRTRIFHDDRFRDGAAVLALVRTDRPMTVFKTQHFAGSSRKMVITGAETDRRIVHEINGDGAANEYARLIGLRPDELTPGVFAAHPVVVRIGGQDYVRSIQKANRDGSLTFYCAIDEGLVLSLGRPVGMVEDLKRVCAEVRGCVGIPDLIIGCDCILRRLHMMEEGLTEAVSGILQENRTVGFATYGEQFNAMHVNQTFTGVAIGPAS